MLYIAPHHCHWLILTLDLSALNTAPGILWWSQDLVTPAEENRLPCPRRLLPLWGPMQNENVGPLLKKNHSGFLDGSAEQRPSVVPFWAQGFCKRTGHVPMHWPWPCTCAEGDIVSLTFLSSRQWPGQWLSSFGAASRLDIFLKKKKKVCFWCMR